MSQTATLGWFAAHELRLSWREWVGMMTGGRRTRGVVLVIVMLVVSLLLHALALGFLHETIAAGIAPDKPTLLLISGFGGLMLSAMLSQALESVTRAYYARSDLDLVISSPASSQRLFAIRTLAIVLSTALLACVLAAPAVNVLALFDSPRWLAAYPVLIAVAALAVAASILITVGLFRLVGPRRTRLIAQIVAAVVGASFVIGIQGATILYYGEFSRFALFQSDAMIAVSPAAESWLWLPARAAMGEPWPLALMIGLGALVLTATIAVSASGFGRQAIAAGATSHLEGTRHRRTARFRPASPRQALRRKEWTLLARDPWLVSQSLMQLLYLIPPALLLWVNYGGATGALVIVAAVLVMASGQLSGGLAWLAVSGEDAYDLVRTAPVSPRAVLIAKIEAVLAIVAVILAPLVIAIAFSSWWLALVTAICAALATASATAIQLWFRTASKRSMFRRRQVSSRVATISEAIVSIMWAGTAAVWASGSAIAIVPATIALLTLGFARLIAPRRP
jgi:ABC-2 type transport system permease protein